MAAILSATGGIYLGSLIAFSAAAVLLSGVTLPIIREVEFGFPSGMRILAAVRDRKTELGTAFGEHQKELTQVASLLCDDPGLAKEAVELAWEKTMRQWRGPVTPAIHVFVLCTLVHVLTTQRRWLPVQPKREPGPLSTLTMSQRTAVVLHAFAGLTHAQISAMTGRTISELKRDLAAAEYAVTSPDVGV